MLLLLRLSAERDLSWSREKQKALLGHLWSQLKCHVNDTVQMLGVETKVVKESLRSAFSKSKPVFVTQLSAQSHVRKKEQTLHLPV